MENNNDLRTKRTQTLIKNAFTDLLYHIPFEKLTVKKITEKAMVGNRTFYQYFMDKYDLAEKITKECLQNFSYFLTNKSGLFNRHISQIEITKSDKMELNDLMYKLVLLRKIKIPELDLEKKIKKYLQNNYADLLHNEKELQLNSIKSVSFILTAITMAHLDLLEDDPDNIAENDWRQNIKNVSLLLNNFIHFE